jgi:spore coat protein U-like protein
MNRFNKSLLACGLLAAASPLWGGQATGNFGVSGTVVSTCTVSGTALSFGTTIPTPIASNVDAQTTVTATCSNGTPYTILLGAGGGAGATVAVRKLTSGGNTINYSLYTDTNRTSIWGDGTLGTTTVGGNGNGAAQPVTVFGRIPATQTVPIGTYTDTIQITLNF